MTIDKHDLFPLSAPLRKEDDEDAARPCYRDSSRSFMHFVESDHASMEDPDDTSTMISRVEQGSIQETSIAQGSARHRSIAELEEEASAQSKQEQSSYSEHQRPRSLHVGDRETRHSSANSVGELGDTDQLASVLTRAFNLSQQEKLVGYYPAWLLKSVMLQGHLYVTTNHICFYSYIPRKDDVTIKSGYLSKRSRTTSRQHRHWFILKNHVLSYYHDPSDLYYPNGNIDMRRATSVTLDIKNSSDEQVALKLITTDREYFFRADTASAANDWIKVLQKMIFRLHNNGECVKIAIPTGSILDVEECDILPFAETMKIKIADDAETYAINEYYFSFFSVAEAAFEAIRSRTRDLHNQDDTSNMPKTTGRSAPISDTSKSAPGYRQPKFLEKLAQEKRSSGSQDVNVEEFTRTLKMEDETPLPLGLDRVLHPRRTAVDSSPDYQLQHTPLENLQEQAADRQSPSKPTRKSTLTKTLGNHIRNVGQAATSVIQAPINIFSKSASAGDPGAEDVVAGDSFRREFGLQDNERLLKTCQPFLRHGVPVNGELYIGDAHVCYRSSTPGTKVRIMVPMDAVEAAREAQGFQFGFSGLVLSIRAHEALFFEFGHAAERNQCIHFIEGALENLKALHERNAARTIGRDQGPDEAQNEHRAFDRAHKAAGNSSEKSGPPTEDFLGVPALIFDSPNASMVAFKPQSQLRFTCLTIGSRGDVQPYVALCKGLIADGQKAKIATHEEFRDFVTSHGIEFAPVEGNPAELMAICVEHGMFTYSFLKEASKKFRGWIDDLLTSSWQACQNTDVLIESPSAMGGIHIAEALGVPYFRAFTMPWSKTRVYPHAFAVPDHDRGGNYNAFTYSAFDNLFWKAISGQINRWRKHCLSIPSTSYDQLAQHKVPFLYNFSPSVVPPAIDWPDWIKVTGYWFLDGSDDKDGEKWQAPAEVVNFIKKARDDDKKLVYIGFGSIVVSDPDALTKAVIEAVNQSGVRCILVKGWSARSSAKEEHSDDETEVENKGTVDNEDAAGDKDHEAADQQEGHANFGDNILSLESIPHDWLFPQIDAACHHGGAGSLGASLRAGIPTIVKPFFGDQYFFGDRVHNLGAGVCLRKLTVPHLKDALLRCTTNKLTIAKAKAIGEQIRSELGVDFAIQSIYRDLDYAKSLIKRPRRSASTSEGSDESWQELEKNDAASDADDEDLFENKRDAQGKTHSILKPFKSLRLPNPLGERSRNYGLSGIKLFKQKAQMHSLHGLV